MVAIANRPQEGRPASRPPDEEHAYGHEKADYLSAGVKGALILLAAVGIAYSAVGRLVNPRALSDVGVGLAVSVGASLVNLVVARVLIGTGSGSASSCSKRTAAI